MSKITEVINELKIKPKKKASLKETELLIKILTKIEQSFLNNKKCDYSKLMIADSKNEIKYENQKYKFGGYAYSIIFEYKSKLSPLPGSFARTPGGHEQIVNKNE